MIDRIKLLIETQNMTASQFADKIDVQRSSLSHIMSGRNKASLDFVSKVLKRFPEISPDWLINGQGALFRSQKTGNESTRQETPQANELFNMTRVEQTEELVDYGKQIDDKNSMESESSGQSENNITEDKKSGATTVDRIVIFYSDGSFKDYSPSKH